MKVYDRFALSAKPDYFVAAECPKEQDVDHTESGYNHLGELIHRLEYSDNYGSNHGSGDVLSVNILQTSPPQFIFQLGRLILPATYPDVTQKLPFVAVVDILDPQKAVWLIHVPTVAEDPEEGHEWYPSQYVLSQLACLFDRPGQRKPAYHAAQIAPSLEEWEALDYDTMIRTMEETRCRGMIRLKLARWNDFAPVLREAQKRAGLRTAVPAGTSELTLKEERLMIPRDLARNLEVR